MGTQHPVGPGDHLSRVGRKHGFRGYPPIWNDPGNADLRQRRANPHIMAAGDMVAIPPVELREVDRATEQHHKFIAQLPKLVLRMNLDEWDRRTTPVDGAKVQLDGKDTPTTKASDGQVEIPIEPLTDRCTIKIGDREILVRLGFLEPVSTVPGYRERLNNLGYRAGDSSDPTNLTLRSAVEEFQCDYKLFVDGVCGQGTQTELTKVHGC